MVHGWLTVGRTMLAEPTSIPGRQKWIDPPHRARISSSLVQVATDVVLEIQVPMGSELQGRGRFTRRPSPGAHGPKVAHRWAGGSSDPRRSTHGARGILYM